MTMKRNTYLESRVTELEAERDLWKKAHATVLERWETENQTHNVQLARQIFDNDVFFTVSRSVSFRESC